MFWISARNLAEFPGSKALSPTGSLKPWTVGKVCILHREHESICRRQPLDTANEMEGPAPCYAEGQGLGCFNRACG